MSVDDHFRRYRDLQAYVGWTDADAARVSRMAGRLEPYLPEIINKFYQEIERHEATRSVITGGPAQVQRLKGTLLAWLRELLAGEYGPPYVERRWQVGRRHVELGLDQVYTNAALSRIRGDLLDALHETWVPEDDPHAVQATVRALNLLLDLDLALIEDAYQTEHSLRRQRVERLATIGQVAGGVAHELRNPLNVIKTSVYYLRNARSVTPDKREEHLRRIERHVELADGVITTLSNFAKLPAPQAQAMNLDPCLREALEVNPVDGSIRVHVDLPPEFPLVSADASQLQIVFGNLIRNARDAMPAGGTLTIEGRSTGAAVDVTVRDTGVGISAEDLARIMEPLYTTKARGLGLGLAIARAILEKNHGELRVTSTPGHGSAFTVRLAVAATPEGQGAATP